MDVAVGVDVDVDANIDDESCPRLLACGVVAPEFEPVLESDLEGDVVALRDGRPSTRETLAPPILVMSEALSSVRMPPVKRSGGDGKSPSTAPA